MSCTHYRTMEPRCERLHMDFKYPYNCYTTSCHTSTVRSSHLKVCSNNRGDPPDLSVQMGRIASVNTCEASRYRDSAPAVSTEKMQMHLKFLEESNAMMHLRNQSLIEENKNLARRLEENATKIEKLQGNMSLMQDEFDNERIKLADLLTKPKEVYLKDKCTSSTNIVPMIDCGIQIWEACKVCHRDLEGCQREPSTITITKSELELLEGDMRILRDAVIAREEAWNKAMEREQNCRRQLARLTAEAIAARHFCETRQDELCMITEILTEKESELKTMQKEILYLNKLIAKLYRQQKELREAEYVSGDASISEKDQRCIEEIAQRVRNIKGKSKTKSNNKCISDKHLPSNPNSCHGSPRESNNGKDQAGSSENHRN